MKDWQKELLVVMSQSNIDDMQKDIINFFNKKLLEIISEVKDRDPILAENLKNRFVN